MSEKSEEVFVKPSRKSKMKKRPEDWQQLKMEIAKELGLWDKVAKEGWSALSAVESGRIGGIFSRRKKLVQLTDPEEVK
ncbi:MAG: small, acid-soluble spore protein, alpha/beta type [Clostridiales bacterium]